MRVSAISATPFQLDTLPSHLPADADRTAPTSGSGTWVTAPGAHLDNGVTVYVHGGGFQFANPDVERVMAYRLSQATGRPVMSVDYRLAPEHRYPAALDDIVAAYRSLSVPPSKILLAGESAGGTLVLSALLVLKEAGDALPGGALVVSPQTDMTLSSPSIDANDGRDVVNRFVLDHVRTQYLDGAAADRAPQSPLHGDLRGLPPLLLIAGDREVMLDDARRFAEAASAAGVEVDLDIYQNMTHAFHAAILPADPPQVAATLMERITRWSDR